MNITEATDLVALRLGDRTDLNAKILAEMGNVQEFILERERELPWFLVSEDSTISTMVGEDRLPLPSNFIREFELGALWYPDASDDVPWKMLCKTPQDRMRKSLGVTIPATDRPTNYAIVGKYFILAPVPNAVYTLSMKYYKQDTNARTLTGTETNEWLVHAADLLVASTCVVLGRQLRFRDDAQRQFEMDRAEAADRFWRDSEAREHANMRYVMGI